MMTQTFAGFMSDVRIPRKLQKNIIEQLYAFIVSKLQVGGALGLWFSLGVLQVLQEIIARVRPFAKKSQVCGNE